MAGSVANQLQHAVEIAHRLVVPDTQDAQPLGLHPGIAAGVRPAIDVGYPIDLKNEPSTWTVEIGYIRADDLLPAELQPIKLTVAQRLPQFTLWWGRLAAHRPGVVQ